MPLPARPGAPLGKGRPILFRLLAVVLSLLVLGFIEMALRVVGVGYSPGFFLKTTQNGRRVFIENPSFSKRYFPPGLERAPLTLVLQTPKPTNTIRIFVLGESAAMGDPEPAYGFARILETMLRESMRGRNVEVVNVAVTAINSHVVREIARDCADKEGDYWIVYLGNNEVIGPYGAGTVFGDAVPALSVIRSGLALKRTRIGQAVDSLIRTMTRSKVVRPRWEGMQMFLDRKVPANDPRLARVYEHFARNLDDIVRLGQRSGAKVLLATVAANLKDCPPFASVHRPGLSPAELAAWGDQFESALAQLKATNSTGALAACDAAGRIDDQPAQLHFARGLALLRGRRTNEAQLAFGRSLELDALRFRADARINQIIVEAAQRSSEVELVDVGGELARRSPDHIPGEEFFHEHVHFNFAGNYIVARAFAEKILKGTTSVVVSSEEDCARLLAHTRFDQYRVLDEVRQRLLLPPFTNQLDHLARMERVRRRLEALDRASFLEARSDYEKALAFRPEDWVLRENFATLLHDFGETESAMVHWKKMLALVPHSADACLGIANTLDAMNRPRDAVLWFRQALRRSPEWVEARHGLGLALMTSGDAAGAVREFKKVLQLQPDLIEARLNLGAALARAGRFSDAKAQLNDVLRVAPENEQARRLLGQIQTGSPGTTR